MKEIAFAMALVGIAGGVGAAQDVGSPRMNYMLHCSGCHAADARGSPKFGVPDMRGTVGHFFKVPNGREFLIQAPGMANSPLSDAETAEMANWMVNAFSPNEKPAGTPPFSTEEVARLRANPLPDAMAVRSDIVKRLKALGSVIE